MDAASPGGAPPLAKGRGQWHDPGSAGWSEEDRVTTSGNTAAAKPKTFGRLPFPLQEGEQVLQVYRRHWLYLWPRLFPDTLIAAVPVVAIAVLLSKAGALDSTGAKVFWIAAAAYLVYWAVRMLLTYYRYHNDIWTITNQRVVDSFRTSPFNLKISTADLINVQDMTVERNGLLRTALDYGDIVCQTSAELQEFRLAGIHHPQQVQLLVDKERDRERARAYRGQT
jgi:hypothetical protein